MQARRTSVKRQAIYEALLETKEHPSAEQLFNALKPQWPDLSLGTVYRNLSLFVEDGLAVVVGNVNGQDRFDACTHSHGHFICEGCGAIMDVDLPEADMQSLRRAADSLGGELLRHRLTLYGRCASCRSAS